MLRYGTWPVWMHGNAMREAKRLPVQAKRTASRRPLHFLSGAHEPCVGGLRAGTVHCLLNFIGKPTEVFVQPVEDFALRQVRIG